MQLAVQKLCLTSQKLCQKGPNLPRHRKEVPVKHMFWAAKTYVLPAQNICFERFDPTLRVFANKALFPKSVCQKRLRCRQKRPSYESVYIHKRPTDDCQSTFSPALWHTVDEFLCLALKTGFGFPRNTAGQPLPYPFFWTGCAGLKVRKCVLRVRFVLFVPFPLPKNT